MSKIYQPRRSAEQWQMLVEQWQSSDQSAKQFCDEQNLAYASFCQWRKRLSPTNEVASVFHSSPQDASFFDLSSIKTSTASGWHIVLSLGSGVELTLSQG
jgi:putative transposase